MEFLIATLLVFSSLTQSTYQLPTYTQSNEYDLIDLKPIPKRQYFDSLGGMALGKRAPSRYWGGVNHWEQ
uniref:Uncharacterized protein n=1 Tax=Romanomermis culicivorax TaxID=13658 RepID=A0A915L1Y4_ROMCU